MEDRTALAPPHDVVAQNQSARPSISSDDARGSVRVSGSVFLAGLDAGGAAHLFGWVAVKRALVQLGRLLGIRRTATLIAREKDCHYREVLTLLGLEARIIEESIPKSRIVTLRKAVLSPTWALVLGAAILLVGGSLGLLRLAEGVLASDGGLVGKGLVLVAAAVGADLALAFVSHKFLPKRWLVSLELTSGSTRSIETNSSKDAERIINALMADSDQS